MEDTEAGLPRIDILKDRNDANVVLCAIFYWVAQVLEIKSPLLEIRRSTQAATSTSTNPGRFPSSTLTSPQRFPTKSALKATARMRDLLTPSKTPSNKRGVVFSNDTLNDHDDDSSFFPEAPTKKRRVDSLSPTKPSAGTSSARRLAEPEPAAMAAFHAAASVGDVSASPDVGLSTPHRLHTRPTAASMTVEHQASSSRSRAQAQPLPSRPAPAGAFVQSSSTCNSGALERIWADVEMHRNETAEMAGFHGHPFERYQQRAGVACTNV
ncbi:hypothetical protein BU15DRAFT_82419 [Melanogaster broomeanus]|nr:hypothetical protein BU15DRAFT_82419 [Melanogaster broomeanus]